MFSIVIIYMLLYYIYVYSFYKIIFIFMVKEREGEKVREKKEHWILWILQYGNQRDIVDFTKHKSKVRQTPSCHIAGVPISLVHLLS